MKSSVRFPGTSNERLKQFSTQSRFSNALIKVYELLILYNNISQPRENDHGVSVASYTMYLTNLYNFYILKTIKSIV